MGKVRELLDEWLTSLGGGYNVRMARVEQYVGEAEREDAAAHAAELEAKDRRIAELQCLLDRAQAESVKALDAKHKLASRIRELEAELAKRELPPLPESVREEVERWRTVYGHRPLIAFIDKLYPAPVPQWELDARLLELVPGVMNAPDSTREEVFAIAARIREAGRGNSK